jgi:glutamyl/glutaminyl-tRNA synthetase
MASHPVVRLRPARPGSCTWGNVRTAIERDLSWLGLDWARKERQVDRLAHYDAGRDRLIASDRLYPCYETPEELEFKRKRLLSQGRPPVYDRAALKLGDADRAGLEGEGRRPHWRRRSASSYGWRCAATSRHLPMR